MSYFPDPLTALAALLAVVILVHLAIYLLDRPLLARFSDVWLGWIVQQGHRSEVLKYGVRRGPRGARHRLRARKRRPKSTFYDAFVSIERGVLTTRDRKQHTRRKRKISWSRISDYMLLAQWDRLYDGAAKGLSGTDGAGGWFGRDSWLWFDCLPWVKYLAFDIIGDLAFGAPFRMIEAARDIAPVPKGDVRSAAVLNCTSLATHADDVVHIPTVAVLTGRGEYSMSTGVLHAWVRPIVARVPWYRRGLQNMRQLAGIAIVAVAKHLDMRTDRVDLLSKLQAGKDDMGKPVGRAELTTEALTFLIAGSDTTANSTCAILYHLAANPAVQTKLQKELDEQLGTEDERVATCDQVKRLPFLEACIREALCIHSTSGLGLPRIVPEGGLVIDDKGGLGGIEKNRPAAQHHFRAVLSVPSYTIHRDPAVWDADVEAFRPERCACLGRNLAALELQIIVASIMRRFHFVLATPEEPLATREGFLRKPLRCDVGIKRRDVL
ncbi:cytochrome P450 monooxygenase [Mycena rebaudengoi]|nr:cytochrome P450 monooxygenase [Mycena rebaudengoi]